MKKKYAFLAVMATLSLVVAATVYAGVIEEFAALERAYVPALALTNQPTRPAHQVQESLRRLDRAWQRFVQAADPQIKSYPAFAEAVTESRRKISGAEVLVAADRRYDAHESLEYIRTAFWKVRTGMGIDYLPDRFTAFHDPMEKFAAEVSKPDSDRKTLKTALTGLSSLWSDVEKSGIDAALFKLSPERAETYAKQVRKEREILNQLAGLIDSGNVEALSKAAVAMKSNFAQTYFVFGDFSGLQY
ncbi:MAG: hypothetical protein ACD_87C00086G0002 [uncultured bacterium]|nr:MAG: hypothetical protein ACD_87C00086G0002 [uncultured bacterium]OHE24645.1 MAG: hypothetical protein A2X92_00290 [Syntrophus sp. GWC2_56_31]HBB18231.1 hypothetical protein [Syntrophus sp. (in: bacteria)]